MTKVCILGFGEVGQILAHDMSALGTIQLSVWDPKFADPNSGPSQAFKTCNLPHTSSAAQAVLGADTVISAVTAGQTVDAARGAAASMRHGMIYLDLNSTAPPTKLAAAAIIEAAGARFVEAAVMSPIAPKRLKTPMLMGGPAARAFEASAKALGLDGASVFSEKLGQASAVKMCRSVIVKGMEALLMESMLTARAYGVEDTVLSSLSDLFPNPNWKHHARYMISRSVEHGVRRAEEMREVARTVASVGITPMMAEACADRQDWAAQFSSALSQQDLEGLLDGIASRNAQNNKTSATK